MRLGHARILKVGEKSKVIAQDHRPPLFGRVVSLALSLAKKRPLSVAREQALGLDTLHVGASSVPFLFCYQMPPLTPRKPHRFFPLEWRISHGALFHRSEGSALNEALASWLHEAWVGVIGGFLFFAILIGRALAGAGEAF